MSDSSTDQRRALIHDYLIRGLDPSTPGVENVKTIDLLLAEELLHIGKRLDALAETAHRADLHINDALRDLVSALDHRIRELEGCPA